MVSYQALAFVGLLLLGTAFAASFYFNKYNNGNNLTAKTDTPTTPTQAPVQQQAPAKVDVTMDMIKGLFSKDVVKFGNGDKKLLIVEVSDPSCPFCHVAGGMNTEIGAKMGQQFVLTSQGGTYVAPGTEIKKLVDQGKADFVWLYKQGHGNGEMGTKALYCAFEQGKFWQANDLIMSAKGYDLLNNQIKNDTSKSQQMADFLASAVDTNKMIACLNSGKYDSRLSADANIAQSLGVQGTPGFFLNTTNYAGAYNWNDMKSTADAALK